MRAFIRSALASRPRSHSRGRPTKYAIRRARVAAIRARAYLESVA